MQNLQNSFIARNIKEFDVKVPIHVNKNVKKQICSLVQQVDLIEQNQCDFWIQHIKIILNQLKNLKQ